MTVTLIENLKSKMTRLGTGSERVDTAVAGIEFHDSQDWQDMITCPGQELETVQNILKLYKHTVNNKQQEYLYLHQ